MEILHERRDFLKTATAVVGGLLLGFQIPGRSRLAFAGISEGTGLNAWLAIAPDNVITIFMAKAEMGQSVYTTLPTLIAEELEVDWKKIRVAFAPSLPEFAKFGPFTGGSSSTNGGYEALRQVGAAAREMLVQAAATKWQVKPSECEAKEGFVWQRSAGRKISYGELVAAASQLPVPTSAPLKSEDKFRLIGKPLKRLDSPLKVNGKAEFAIDVKLPGMKTAAVKQAPVFGGRVANLAALQKAAPKDVKIVPIQGGVAAVASHFWRAKKTLEELPIQFAGGQTSLDSKKISQRLKRATQSEGVVAHKQGEIKSSKNKGTQIQAFYEVPYLAHATMEPMSCVANVVGESCEIWCGTQSPFFNKMAIEKAIGVKAEKIKVNTTFLGGGFGRRAEQDFVVQAVTIAKAIGQPVKLIWTREEDTQHDFYRPAFAAQMKAELGPDGFPASWTATNAGSSIVMRWFPQNMKDGLDFTSIEGFKEIGYAIPNQLIKSATVETTVPVGFWRSVGSSQNAFFVESFIDELAHAAAKDPFEYRRHLLAHKPRHKAVLEKAAEMAKWTKGASGGRAFGIAIAESFGTIVAQVAEVSVIGAKVTVHKIYCAYDCGPIVNPDTIVAQMESSIAFGLTAALRGEISIKGGRVEQGNFDSYRMLSLREMPQVEVQRVVSNAKMGGIGEPGTPPVAPAVCNAIFKATGKRVRHLPIEKSLEHT